MKFKKHLTRITAVILSCVFCSTNVFADLNLGNADGTGFSSGTANNYWGVHTDSGTSLNDTEGLRVTVYDAESNRKVFNTIDISGNSNISAVSNIYYFADGSELIPKTTWLNYVGNTYNSLSTNDVTRFNSAVLSRSTHGDGYRVQYVEALSSIDIISINNSSHLEEIKALLSEENFLKNLCDLMSGLKYDDIVKGKYKIAFEPVAYFRYNGQNWAMSATECGLLNKYMKNYFTAVWNSTNNLRALLGPLTHSNLPRSAFLENKDLGIPVYSPSTSDYYNGNSNYNSDTCIIRCMGIGVLTGNSDDNDDEVEEGTAAAEYHTDTDVYTSFYAVNIGDTPFIGKSSFSIFDSGGDTPRMYEQLKEENKELIKVTGSQSAEFKRLIAGLNAELDQRTQKLNEITKQLAEKNQQLAVKTEEVANLTENVEALDKANKSQQMTINEQDMAIHQGHYLIGNRKELKEAEVISRQGIFCPPIVSSQAQKANFTDLDIREMKVIPLNSKKAKLLSVHPADSYTLETGEDGNMTLKINDENNFWKQTKYLVVMIG